MYRVAWLAAIAVFGTAAWAVNSEEPGVGSRAKRSPSRNRKPSLTTHELVLLHAGLGVLVAHYTVAEETAIARCLALRISSQLRLIAEHADLPDPALRPFLLKSAARWRVRALGSSRVSKLLSPYVVSTEAPFHEEASS